MLSTPSTDHVSFRTVYEPAEDSFLFLDTLSSSTEAAWLRDHFDTQKTEAPPLVVEVGTGSGVVLAFATANAGLIFGRKDVLAVGVDINADACDATRKTVNLAIEEKLREEQAAEQPQGNGVSSGQRPRLLATLNADLCTSFNDRSIDVLLFNPPYVPTPELPSPTKTPAELASMSAFDRESYLLELSYAGGDKGMEITDRLLEDIPRVLSERGVAYVPIYLPKIGLSSFNLKPE
ncbi:HemK methyltransferase member 2 [Ascosphaera atra]|nr:HemK methyltransferase member 2 [Ascosphaera atra]